MGKCARLMSAGWWLESTQRNQYSRWPDGLRERRYERRLRRFDSYQRGQVSPRRRTSARALRRLVAGVQLTPGRPFLGQRALGAIRAQHLEWQAESRLHALTFTPAKFSWRNASLVRTMREVRFLGLAFRVYHQVAEGSGLLIRRGESPIAGSTPAAPTNPWRVNRAGLGLVC